MPTYDNTIYEDGIVFVINGLPYKIDSIVGEAVALYGKDNPEIENILTTKTDLKTNCEAGTITVAWPPNMRQINM